MPRANQPWQVYCLRIPAVAVPARRCTLPCSHATAMTQGYHAHAGDPRRSVCTRFRRIHPWPLATCIARLERGSNHGERTPLTLASRSGGVGPLPPVRGVYDDARSLADHDEIRGEVDPTHDTGFFLETSRQRSAPGRR